MSDADTYIDGSPQMEFDYNRPAAIFLASPTATGRPQGYRRFWTAAEAIRFAVEEFPTGLKVCLALHVISSS
jgi:hypothetical protein